MPRKNKIITRCKSILKWLECSTKMGLVHGLIGTMKHIVFADNANPNLCDLPLYVVVDFEHYKGPIVFKDNPTFVPIPCITTNCKLSTKNVCCKRKIIPLQLAFGKTIHTFQGQSVGLVNPGQKMNQFQHTIVNSGN